MRKFIFLLLANFIILSSFAQVDFTNPKKYQIEKINITGIEYLSEDALVLLSGLQVGQIIKIPGDAISESIEKLWEQNLFSDVQISFVISSKDMVEIIIALQEQPRLNNTYFLGIKKSQIKDLEEQLNLKPGRKLTDNILSKSKNIIKDYYSDKGFPNTVVTFSMKDDTTMQNMVNLYVDIDKQNKIKIEEFIIRGNTEFSNNKIKRIFKETKKKNFFRVWKPSKYIEESFKEDKKLLIAKYNKAGYRDARILEDSIYPVESGMLNMYLKIHEGNKYYYRSINWVGNTKYTSEQLSQILDINTGDIYNQERLDNRLIMAEDAVGNLYLDDGYLFYQAIPREKRIENDSVDLEIIIIEGEQARINRIILTGNTRTNDHVALRELRTLPGELFSKSDIIRSVRELAQIGNFDPEQLVPTPVPNQAAGNVDIEYAVIEKSNDMFELSGGWGMIGFVGRVGVKFNNFSVRNITNPKAWAPLPMGDGQQLSLSANIGASNYQLYSISFVEPWLGGKKPRSLSASLYYNLMSNGVTKKQANTYDDYVRNTMQMYGASIGIGERLKWPDDYFMGQLELSYQRYYIDGLTNYIEVASGAYNILSLNTTLSRNSIDNPLYSRRGSNLSASFKITPPYSTISSLFVDKDWKNLPEQDKFKWVELYKLSVKGSWYHQIVGDLVVKTAFEYGILGSFNKDIGYSPFEAYELGGDGMGGYYTFGVDNIGLRGYENRSLTAVGGAHLYSKYTAELRYPVLLKDVATIYALTFVEAGNSWNNSAEMGPFDIYRSAGAGVRVFLPMLGQLGVDFGYGFDEIPFDNGNSNGFNYHFVFGQQF